MKTAANIMRSLALSRATGSGARPLLFLSCEVPNRHEILRAFASSSADDGCSGPAGGGGSGECFRPEGVQQSEGGVQGAGTVNAGMRRWRWQRQRRDLGRRRWLLILARFMARPREFERRRAASVRAFTPQKFRQEWELFWELLDPVSDAVERTVEVKLRRIGGVVQGGR